MKFYSGAVKRIEENDIGIGKILMGNGDELTADCDSGGRQVCGIAMDGRTLMPEDIITIVYDNKMNDKELWGVSDIIINGADSEAIVISEGGNDATYLRIEKVIPKSLKVRFPKDNINKSVYSFGLGSKIEEEMSEMMEEIAKKKGQLPKAKAEGLVRED